MLSTPLGTIPIPLKALVSLWIDPKMIPFTRERTIEIPKTIFKQVNALRALENSYLLGLWCTQNQRKGKKGRERKEGKEQTCLLGEDSNFPSQEISFIPNRTIHVSYLTMHHAAQKRRE